MPSPSLSSIGPRQKKKGVKQSRNALTLDDLYHQTTETALPCSPLTPRALTPLSAEACLRHGIDPEHLRERDFGSFWRPNVDAKVQRMHHNAYGRRRQELMGLATEERERLVKDGGSARGGAAGKLTPAEILEEQERASATLIEMEKRRLVKVQSRQRKELMQTMQFEQKCQAIQASAREKEEQDARKEERRRRDKTIQERRAAEERRIKELRLRTNEEMEHEKIRLLAQEQDEREKKIKKERERKEKESKRRARLLEEERARKAELHQRHTQKVTEDRRLEAEAKMEQREAKERERMARVELQKGILEHEREAKRKEAADRLEANRLSAKEREDKRRTQLLDKQRVHKELQEQKRASTERARQQKQQENDMLERKRAYQLKLARDREEATKDHLRRRFEEDEEYVAELKKAHQKELDLKLEERELNEHFARENVERMKRMQEYHQSQIRDKISQDDMRIKNMLGKREELLKKRREAAHEAKIQKDKMMAILEKTRTGGGRSIKKMLDLISDEGVPDGVAPSHAKSKPTLPSHDIDLNDLGPPPKAPTLSDRLAQNADSSVDQSVEPFKSPYEIV